MVLNSQIESYMALRVYIFLLASHCHVAKLVNMTSDMLSGRESTGMGTCQCLYRVRMYDDANIAVIKYVLSCFVILYHIFQ